METAVRAAFGAIGVLARREVPPPPSPDDRISGIFYGRVAGNVTYFTCSATGCRAAPATRLNRSCSARSPAPTVRPKKPLAATKRYPIVAVQMPRAARAAAKRIRPMRVDYRDWWQRTVLDQPPQGSPTGAGVVPRRGRAVHARRRPRRGRDADSATRCSNNSSCSRPRRSATQRSRWSSATGYGSMEETELIEDLVVGRPRRARALRCDPPPRLPRAGRGRPLEPHVARGPRAARVDRPGLPPQRSREPARPRARQVQRRIEAERRVSPACPRRRGRRKAEMKLAATYIPLREVWEGRVPARARRGALRRPRGGADARARRSRGRVFPDRRRVRPWRVRPLCDR